MRVRAAARLFKIPRSTLRDLCTGKVQLGAGRGRKTELTEDKEQSLVNFIIWMQQIGYPLTRMSLREEVRQLVEKVGRKTRFVNNLPSKYCLFPYVSAIFPSISAIFPSVSAIFPSISAIFSSVSAIFPSISGIFPSVSAIFPYVF